ncbi:MAG: enoyl-CoA hydratase/isomerase family protein [Actinobacteria bacterium]|nr:enoyl-CoA hydratase/isomerase family protein [Actinomycetota bacterium]
MPDPPLVEVRRVNAVAVLTLQREEKLNAISPAVERELVAALDGEEVRASGAVVLAGAGRAFSAGADVDELSGLTPEEIVAYYADTGAVYERFAALPQPTFAAVHGYCLGGGLELALAADFRIADETAVFGFPEVELGILPSSGGTHRLVRLVGPARAKELLLLRPRFSAEEAAGFGLLTDLVPAGQAPARALELAAEAAKLPRLAVVVTKQAVNVFPETSREAAVLIERLAYAALGQTTDAGDAARAWAERRAGPRE